MTILSICSARPNFAKLASVQHAIAAWNSAGKKPPIRHVIVHTGQHYDPLLSDIFFQQLDIPQPDLNLGVHGGTREEVIQRTMEACVPVFEKLKPDWVVVYGDVNGAVGGAQAAKKLGLKLAHVEAGLRSHDLSMPEELNRIEIDRVADLLLVSEQSGMEHLGADPKVKGTSELVGNTMIDTLVRMMPAIDDSASTEDIRVPATYAIATLHRPSNVDTREALQKNIDFLTKLTQHIPVVLPVHHRMDSSLEKFGLSLPPGVIQTPPLPYIIFLRLVRRSAFIVTDSGGIQEEATFLKKKCFTVRLNTERPSTLEKHGGSNTLIDLEQPEHREIIISYAKNPKSPNVKIPKFWDGKTGDRIVKELLKYWEK